VLTDGGDTSSIASFAELDRPGDPRAGVPIYFIAVRHGRGRRRQTELDRLNLPSPDRRAGSVRHPRRAEQRNLQAKYAGPSSATLPRRSHSRFRYQINRQQAARNGVAEGCTVVVNSPKLTARTIRGYFRARRTQTGVSVLHGRVWHRHSCLWRIESPRAQREPTPSSPNFAPLVANAPFFRTRLFKDRIELTGAFGRSGARR